MLQITILGCGSSLGVPIIGCDCDTCLSDSSYNKRTRTSIYIDDGNSQILIDFGFDIKDQLIREKIRTLDAAILTHDHADHVSGIDNLRVFPFIQQKPLNIFADHKTAADVVGKHQYLFNQDNLIMNAVGFFENIQIGAMDVQFFRQNHYKIDSLGIRIGNFVYSTDVLYFYEESKKYLQNIDSWVLDCSGYTQATSHASIATMLSWREEYQPSNIYLTNMSHEIDYHTIINELPKHVTPLYDGYKFTVN